MDTNDNFKNSPVHDKRAILELMDTLNPKQMIKVVELLKQLEVEKPQPEPAMEPKIENTKEWKALPEEIWFNDTIGSNGINCLDYKNESDVKYIRADLVNQQHTEVSDEEIKEYLHKKQSLYDGPWFRVCIEVAKWMRDRK
jgi:hypothetical protein